jgi:hypothetical protein
VIAEAIDTLFIVCRAILAWIAVGAFVVTVCLFTGIAVIAQGVKGARRMLAGPSWRRGRFGARMFARSRLRRSGGRTEPQAYREAA